MSIDYGNIESIKKVENIGVDNAFLMKGPTRARLGFVQMLGTLSDGSSMDGYEVKTSSHRFLVLIDNGQSCCESWGYISDSDDLDYFIGANLIKVELTDVSRFKKDVEELESIDERGIQFVDFTTDKGVFQLAVYNAHNGYYGHGILVVKDAEILLNSTL